MNIVAENKHRLLDENKRFYRVIRLWTSRELLLLFFTKTTSTGSYETVFG